MLFHTPSFVLGFLPACLGGFFLLGRLAGANAALAWLLAASAAFYAWGQPWGLALLAASILGNWWVGRCIAAAAGSWSARAWLAAGIAANLGALAWYKYAGFAWSIIAPSAAALDIALPLAISFLTFQQIMFLADRAAGSRDGLLPYATVIAFFPHLIAGPLVRPAEILPQLRSPALIRPDRANLADGGAIFLLGLGKKLVLADTFAAFADPGFDAVTPLTALEAWFALLAYGLQIYFDFSGYSDMAIGLARMLNIRFPLNFDSPYRAATIADFWRRWHITLGQFLRDFVYIPLGGSRRGIAAQAAALMATMLLCGLWHGAAWRFVAWGGLHGVFLAVHAAWRRTGRTLPPVLAHPLTLLCVSLAWVPFRAADLASAWDFVRALSGANGCALPAAVLSALPALAAIASPVPVLGALGDGRTLSLPEAIAWLAIGWGLALGVPQVHRWTVRARHWTLAGGGAFIVQALFFAPQAAPFLYFRF